MWADVSARLNEIRCPMVVFGSDEDHVVEPSNSVEVVKGVSSTDVTFIPLHDSYHVATLDNDAEHIFEQSTRVHPTHRHAWCVRSRAVRSALVTTVPGSGDPDDGDEREPEDLNDPKSIDAAFDEIVSNIDRPSTAASTAPWPDAEGDSGDAGDSGGEAEPVTGGPAAMSPRTPRSDWSEWEDVRVPAPEEDEHIEELDADADEEGHYVPPPPPPVPKGDSVTRWAWAGAIGAPVLGLLLLLLGWNLDGMLGLLLVAAFLAGFVTLVSRLRTGPRIDDGPDDGAVV